MELTVDIIHCFIPITQQHYIYIYIHVCACVQARQTRPNSEGVAEGHPRFDKGGGCNNFLLFTR